MNCANPFLVASLLLCGVPSPGLSLKSEPPCVPITIGLDLSQAGNSAGVLFGDSPGQTFFAADTLLRSLTAWRVASQANNGFGIHLFITETDSTGRPDNLRIVFDGPTIVRTDGDGINPTPFHWYFDPPVSLPAPGTYAFFLSPAQCFAFCDVLSSGGRDLYAAGNLWGSGRGCALGGYPHPVYGADLIFQIEFCSTDTPTPTQSRSWGSLKGIYR